MKTIMYLVRHGEYESPDGIIPYRMSGFHLSTEGKKQAERRAAGLADVPLAAVFSSPMERTRETAEIIARPHGLVPIVDERLNEVRSPLQGKTKTEIDALGGWFLYEHDWYKKAGGEAIKDIRARIIACIEERRKEYEGKTILMVSHGDPIMLAASYYNGSPISLKTLSEQPYVPMAGGYKIVFTGHKISNVYPIVSS